MTLYQYQGLEHISYCSQFNKELSKLFGKSTKNEAEYKIWLYTKLLFLNNYGLNAALSQMPNNFELLIPHSENLHCIRHTGFEGNPRIIFFPLHENDVENEVLVVAFQEKQTSSDYQNAITKACARKNEILAARTEK